MKRILNRIYIARGVAAALLGLGLFAAGCRSKSAMEVPSPAILGVRWADGSRIDDLVLVSMNGLPYKSLSGAWPTWKREKTVPLSLGSHTLEVRLPYRVTQYGYKEVRNTKGWTIRVLLKTSGSYTAFLDPDSDAVTAKSDKDGTSVDIVLPTADAAALPATNAPTVFPR